MAVKSQRWHPPKWSVVDARAWQALALYANGISEQAPGPEDVKRAMDWLVIEACGTYDEPFQPEQSDVVTYLLGRRSIGLSVVKMIKIKPEIAKGNEK